MAAKRRGKSNKKAGERATVLALRPITTCVLAALAPYAAANPAGHQVAAGSATVQASGKTLTITNTPGTILNWQSFSIAPGELTKFVQQSAASAVLNRVVAANPSSLLGTLQSNGRVFLVNPHGIVVGPGALIDTAGFVASTLNIADRDFLAGRLKFEGGGAGVLRNEGTIRATRDIFLVGPQIENARDAIIHSVSGDVVLAAGRSITITSPDAHGVQFGIQAPEDSVVNLGKIQAANAVGLFGGTLKHSGEINVTSASLDSAGRVVLSAQAVTELRDAKIAVDNSAAKGGKVEVLGEYVGLFGESLITATGAAGGGAILVGGDYKGLNPDVRNAYVTWFGPNAKLDASATSNGDGGKVIVWADHTARAHGHITVRGGVQGGNGGLVETSGKRYLEATRAPDIGAPAGRGGRWLLDPVTVTVNGPEANIVTENTPPDVTYRPQDSDPTTLSVTTLQTAVSNANGGVVEITTQAQNTSNTAGFDGDIIFNSRPNFNPGASGATLKLNAHRNVTFTNGLTKTGTNPLTIEFTENTQGPGGVAGDPVYTISGGITSPVGGNLTLKSTPPVGFPAIPIRFSDDQTIQNFATSNGTPAWFDVTTDGITVTGTVSLGGASKVHVNTPGPGGQNLTGDSNANIIIRNGAELRVEDGRSLFVSTPGAAPRLTIESGGTFTKGAGDHNPGTNSVLGWQLNSTGGTVLVENATLTLNPGTNTMASTAVGGSTAIFKADGATSILDLNAATTGASLSLGDDVSIQTANGGSVTLSSTTDNALRFTGTGLGTTLAANSALNLTGRLVGGTGKLNVLGTLAMNDTGITGSVVNGATGVINLSGNAASQIDSGLTLEAGSTTNFTDSVQTQLILAGTTPNLTWNGGAIVNAATGSGLITLNPNGTLTAGSGTNTIGAGITLDNANGTTVVSAGATLAKAAGTLNAGAINNGGTVRITNGTQSFANGGTSTDGIFTADAGTTINFTGMAPYNLTGAATRLNGPGNFGVGVGATLNVTNGSSDTAATAITNQGTVTLTDSSLGGPVTNQAGATLNLVRGVLNDALDNSGNLNSMGAAGDLNRLFGNFTTRAGSAVNIGAGTTLRAANTATFAWEGNNNALTGTGTFEIQGPLTMPGGGTRIVNGPTVHVTGATTLPAGQTLRVQSGTINFDSVGAGASNYAGTLTADGGTTITFTSGGHAFNTGAAWGGTGTVVVNGAQAALTFNTDITKTGGSVDFMAGFISGPRSLILNGGATLRALGAGDKTFNTIFIDAQNGVQALAGRLILNDATLQAGAAATVAAGAEIQIDGTSVLEPTAGITINGTVTQNNGQFNPTGMTNAATGVFHFNGGTFTPQGAANVDNAGIININNTASALDLITNGTHTGTFNVAASTRFDISAGNHIFSNTARIAGTGEFWPRNGAATVLTFNAAGAASPIIASTVAVDNDAMFNVASGTMSIGRGPTAAGNAHSGTFDVANGAMLNFTSGTHTLGAGSDVTGTGAVVVSGGTVNVNGNYGIAATGTTSLTGGNANDSLNFNVPVTFANTFTLTGGEQVRLGGSGNIVMDGPFNWTGGADIGGSGVLTTNGTTTVTGNGGQGIGKPWTNMGTVNFAAGGLVHFFESVTLTNGPTGVINFANGSAEPIGHVQNAPTLTNLGTINKPTAGVQNIPGGIAFNNAGAGAGRGVNVTAGTLRIDGPGADTGAYTVGDGGVLQFNGGPRSYDGVVFDVAGPSGQINFTAGTHNVTNATPFNGTGTVTNNGATININTVVLNAGTFETQGGAVNVGGPVSIAAGATLRLGAFFALPANQPLDNAGTFDLVAGVAGMDQGTHTGTFIARDGTTLNLNGTHTFTGSIFNSIGQGAINFTGGTLAFGGASQFIGTGTIANTGAAMNVNADANATVSLFRQTAGSLNLAGGMFTKDSGTFALMGGTVSGPRTLQMTNAATFASSGGGNKTLNNIFVSAQNVHASAGTLLLQNATVSAAGAVTIDGGAAVEVGAGSVFDVNAGGQNAGTVTLNGGQLNINNAAFNNTSNTSLVVNSGAFTANAAFNNTGTFTLTDGTAELKAGGVHTNGTFNVAAGESLDFSGGQNTLSGTALTGAGVYRLSGGNLHAAVSTTSTRSGGPLEMSGTPTIDGRGTINFTNGASLELTGAGVKTVGHAVNGGPEMNLPGPFTVGAGELSLLGGLVNVGGALTIAPNATLRLSTGGLFYGVVNGVGPFDNHGTLAIEGGAWTSGGLGGTHTGIFNAAAGTSITFTAGTHTLNGAQLNGAGTIAQSGGTVNVVTNDVTANAATFRVTGGTFTVPAGRAFSHTGGAFQVSGSGTFVNSGMVNNTNAVQILAGGRVSGVGTFSGNVLNIAGTLSPGASPGRMIILGNYTQQANGTLEIGVEGINQGAAVQGYDWLDVRGQANLNGTLNLIPGGGFTPGSNDVFNFLTAGGGIFGNFTTVNAPGFGALILGPNGFSVMGAGAGGPNNNNMVTSTASNDVVALQNEEQTSGEVIEKVQEDDKKKEKGAICTG